ncbi:hypothetical protein LDENG_00064240, partial [Lucifuga dentata]
VNYGSASSIFSEKGKFPTFLRTVHPNKDVIRVIFTIMQHFNWRWVAFLTSDDDYSKDGLELFTNMIKDTEICLAFTAEMTQNTNYLLMFKQINAQKIPTIIVFAVKRYAEILIQSAIRLNVTNKVWIAVDTWALNKKLPKEKGIKNIGTVLGATELVVTIPGFNDFIYASKKQKFCKNAEQEAFCNQDCNCSRLSPEAVLAEDPTYSFPIYSATYAIAHSLHKVLQCDEAKCNRNIKVYPHMVLAELKKSNFTLLNRNIRFDENGDPDYGSYSIIFWNNSGKAQEIGFYKFHPTPHFFINNTQIQWHGDGEEPISRCSPECDEGFAKRQDGIHKCCFNCEICSNGTYVNATGNS